MRSSEISISQRIPAFLNCLTTSFRYRNGEQKNQIPIKQAIDEVLAVIKDRTQI